MHSIRSGQARQPELVRIGPVTIECHVDGDGDPIVLLPSLGRGARDFEPLVPHLIVNGFRVLRPEPRGFGRSNGPAEGLSLQALAHDIAGVIDAKAGGRAIVLGHAFGNWVARVTAVEHPNLVRGVVLAAAAAREQSPEVRAALAICHDDSKPREARLAALQFAFFAPGHDPSVFLDGWSHAAIAIERQATAASPRAAWWHGGSAPILDLQAALDPFRPPSTRSENVDEFGSRVTVTVVADASHALIPEQPEAVAAAIADWSRTLP